MTSNIQNATNEALYNMYDDDDVVRTPRAASEFDNAVVTASVEGAQIDRLAADNALPAIDSNAVRAAPTFNNAVVTA